MLAVAIQAGGASRRMGTDKALLPFLGQPLVQRVWQRVAPLADEALVTTNRPQDYRFLSLRLVPDLAPGRGALGGLYTALAAAHEELVAVVACDLPFASPAVLAAARDLLKDPAVDAVVPRPDGGTEPFHAVYRRRTCLPAVHRSLVSGRWRADSWWPAVNIRWLAPPEIAALDPEGLAFRNVNTPEAFRAAEAAARRMEQPGAAGA